MNRHPTRDTQPSRRRGIRGWIVTLPITRDSTASSRSRGMATRPPVLVLVIELEWRMVPLRAQTLLEAGAPHEAFCAAGRAGILPFQPIGCCAMKRQLIAL